MKRFFDLYRSWRARLTLLAAAACSRCSPPFVDWAFLDAVWRPDAKACRAASGACWGFIAEKHRFILFGTYPYERALAPAARHRSPFGPVGAFRVPRVLETMAHRASGWPA